MENAIQEYDLGLRSSRQGIENFVDDIPYNRLSQLYLGETTRYVSQVFKDLQGEEGDTAELYLSLIFFFTKFKSENRKLFTKMSWIGVDDLEVISNYEVIDLKHDGVSSRDLQTGELVLMPNALLLAIKYDQELVTREHLDLVIEYCPYFLTVGRMILVPLKPSKSLVCMAKIII